MLYIPSLNQSPRSTQKAYISLCLLGVIIRLVLLCSIFPLSMRCLYSWLAFPTIAALRFQSRSQCRTSNTCEGGSCAACCCRSHLVYGVVWCTWYGEWCMVYDAWCMMHDVRCMMCTMYYAWCMMYDVWCMMHSVWCMINDACCMMHAVWRMMYSVWWMVHDVWCMRYAVRYMLYDACCIVHNVWCMMYDAWCMMFDVWCMMYDVRCKVLGVCLWCMMYVCCLPQDIIKMKIHSSCEIEDFVETHLCKLCVMLRSRVLRVMCPHQGYRSATPLPTTVVSGSTGWW